MTKAERTALIARAREAIDELERIAAKWDAARETIGAFNAEALRGISLATLIEHWNIVNKALDLTPQDERDDERETGGE